MRFSILATLALSWLALGQSLSAALILNSAQPITERVNVNVIAVADNAGANPAPLFGSASEQASIFSLVDQIWAQAGIDVEFSFRAGTYNNTFALTGTTGNNNPRPTGDLSTIRSNAASAGGVLSPDPNTINLFMVRIVPGFSQTSDNTSNGLAFLNANGIALWAGPNLPGFLGGREVIASVLAHEIGHNLGLDHIVEAENLLQAGGSSNPGQRLNSTQISTARASAFSVPIPEPTTYAAVGLVVTLVMLRSRRRLPLKF
jgi:hypothetical protein